MYKDKDDYDAGPYVLGGLALGTLILLEALENGY